MRLAILAVAASLMAASAWAQDASTASPAEPAPAIQQETADPLEMELKRLRADFRARFVDYDARLEAMSRRIEALEAALAGTDGIETDSSSITMEPPTADTTETPSAD